MENNKQMLVLKLFTVHQKALKKFLYQKTNSSPLTEKLLQNLFLKICSLECIPSPKECTTKAYLYKEANNLLIDDIIKKFANLEKDTLEKDQFDLEHLNAIIEKNLLNRKNKTKNFLYYLKRKNANTLLKRNLKDKFNDFLNE